MANVNGAPVSVEHLLPLALTNYGHFTTMRVENGAVRGLSLHLARLVQDCATVFGAELDAQRVLRYVRQEVGRCTDPLTVRVTVFDPDLDMAHPAGNAEPHVLVTTRPAGSLAPPPLRVTSLAFGRDTAAVKHIAMFSQLRLRREAQLAGFEDVVFTDPDGRISEGCTWNIGFVDGSGQVVWPDADMLPGVTMRLLQGAHRQSIVRAVPVGELPSLRAAFATNAAIGVRAIRAIDDVRFPEDDAVFAALRDAYVALPVEPL